MSMILADIDKISYDPRSKGYSVLLSSFQDDRYIEILISTKDAKQISLAKEGVNLPRPSSHDLLLDIINNFDVKLKKIIITDLKESTYYARLILYSSNLGEVSIDSRPSDAIVLSLKTGSPLYIHENLFSEVLNVTKNDKSQIAHEDENVDILLENLNKALNKAVIVEEYETAARLRDQINSLKKR